MYDRFTYLASARQTINNLAANALEFLHHHLHITKVVSSGFEFH